MADLAGTPESLEKLAEKRPEASKKVGAAASGIETAVRRPGPA